MKRAEGLALIRKAGYLGNFKSMIELRCEYKISHNVALKEFRIGQNAYKEEIKQMNVDAMFDSAVLSNN
jgi:hypothetical protein